ncbi:MAG: hypothetical protein R3E42_17860 [Burkholderiaceae bacterium]
MSDQDAFATAAHLHVLLRRKTGRVTDTEWMATNPEYARAMVAFASEAAEREGLDDLRRLARKLASLIPSMGAPVRKPLLMAAAERRVPPREPKAAEPVSGFRESTLPFADSESPGGRRYVGGIR